MCETTNEHTRCRTNKPKTSDAFTHARLVPFAMKQRDVLGNFCDKKHLEYFGFNEAVKCR